ncbi:AMP-binding protein [Bradyrhizobium nitroreducens]|nr:AMP-binding protein [Bradyrhizobium nitroreducens]
MAFASSSDGQIASKSVLQLFADHAIRLADRICMREKNRGIWRQWTWGEVFANVRALAVALRESGIRSGDRVGIIGENRPRLYWALSAAQWLRCVPMPMAADTPADMLVRLILEHDISVVVVDGSGQYEKLAHAAEAVRPALKYVIVDNVADLEVDESLTAKSLDEVILSGKRDNSTLGQELDQELRSPQQRDCLAYLPFPDVTLGSPPASWTRTESVWVVQADAVGKSLADSRNNKISTADGAVAYLPFGCWTDLYGSHILPLSTGMTVNFPEAADTVSADVREIGPTIHFVPDWLVPKLRDATLARVGAAGRDRLVRALDRCRERNILLTVVARTVLLWPLRDVLGFSRVRAMFIAGVPRDGTIEFLAALGIKAVSAPEAGPRTAVTSAVSPVVGAKVTASSVVH